MSLRNLLWKGGEPTPPPEPAATDEPATEPQAPVRLATGPVKRRTAPMSTGPSLRRPTFATGLSKVNSEKLADLRKRVFGSVPTPLTQILDQADKLAEAGISDDVVRFRGAIKTTGVALADLRDAVTTHKTTLLQQREGFARHLTGKREETSARREAIAKEAEELQQRHAALIAEDESLAAQQQELDAAEAEFKVVADTLEAEITTTGDQLVALYATPQG